MATERFDTVSRVVIVADQPTTGVLDIFSMPGIAQAPPRWVAEDASMYLGVNWDLQTAYDAVERLVDMFQGEGALRQIMDRAASEPNGPKIHPKKDFIDLLSGRMHFITDIGDSDAVDNERFLFGLDLAGDGTRMSAVLDKIAQTPGFPGEIREFRGGNIYQMEAPGQTFGVAVAHGSLLLASDVGLLEQAIRGDRAPLSGSDAYRRLAAHLPERASIVGFERQGSQLQAVYEMLRSGQLGPLGGIDTGVLPPFEAIERYIPANGSYVVPDERGAMMVQFTLAP